MPVAFEPFVRGLEQWELSNWQALVEPDPDLNELFWDLPINPESTRPTGRGP